MYVGVGCQTVSAKRSWMICSNGVSRNASRLLTFSSMYGSVTPGYLGCGMILRVVLAVRLHILVASPWRNVEQRRQLRGLLRCGHGEHEALGSGFSLCSALPLSSKHGIRMVSEAFHRFAFFSAAFTPVFIVFVFTGGCSSYGRRLPTRFSSGSCLTTRRCDRRCRLAANRSIVLSSGIRKGRAHDLAAFRMKEEVALCRVLADGVLALCASRSVQRQLPSSWSSVTLSCCRGRTRTRPASTSRPEGAGSLPQTKC